MKKLALIICLPALIAGCGKKDNENAEAPTPSTKPNAEAPKPPAEQPKAGQSTKPNPPVVKPKPASPELIVAWEKAGLSREQVAAWEKAGFEAGWMRLHDDLLECTTSLGALDISTAVPAFDFKNPLDSMLSGIFKSLPVPSREFGLSLFLTQITDVGLKEVAKLKNLTVLTLWECEQITDAGLKEVGKLQNLTKLSLITCEQITGMVRNTSDETFKQVELKFIIYDDQGTKLGETIDYSQELGPNMEWRFRAASMFTNVARADLAEVIVR